jgi:recombination DNA repair RAD52 pathway protein
MIVSNLKPPDDLSTRADRILWELRQPLAMSRVKRRPAPGSGTVPYLQGYDVINRANAIFDFAWSFDLLTEPVVVWNQQEGRKVPQEDANGNFQMKDVGIVYVTGKVSLELDDQTICHADLGRCIFTGDTPEALDTALAGAVTDCLKRCLRQLGEQFGNSLYDKEIAHKAGLNHHRVESKDASGRRASAVSRRAAPARVYGDGTSVNGNLAEQKAYDQFVSKMGKPPVSKADLRTWLSTQRAAAPSVAA